MPAEAPDARLEPHRSFSIGAAGEIYYGTTRNIRAAEYDLAVAHPGEAGFGEGRPIPGGEINTPLSDLTPFIARDGSCLLTTHGRADNARGGGDIYIRFRHSDGTWTTRRRLAVGVNSGGNDLAASVSTDGRYFFWMSDRSGLNRAYWMRADFIEAMRAQELGESANGDPSAR